MAPEQFSTPAEQFAVGLEALRVVQDVFPEALITGGFIRDSLYGVRAKDIDIVVAYSDTALRDLLDQGFTAQVMNGTEYGTLPGVSCIINMEGYAFPVQLIVLEAGRTVAEDVASNDFSFCQVSCDGVRIWQSEAFSEGFNTGKVTLDVCESKQQFDRSMRRWERLKVKYPSLELVIPLRFACYDKEEALF